MALVVLLNVISVTFVSLPSSETTLVIVSLTARISPEAPLPDITVFFSSVTSTLNIRLSYVTSVSVPFFSAT